MILCNYHVTVYLHLLTNLITNRNTLSKFKHTYVYRYATYNDLCGYIKRNELYSKKILETLEQLRNICISLSEHHPTELVDDAVVLCLRMFMKEDKVLLKHMLNIRSMFGTVSENTVIKICEVSLD